MAEKKRWFLYGCLGCLGIVVLVVVAGATISGVALFQVRQEQVERQVSTHELPTAVVSEPASPGQPASPPETGRVRLDLAHAEFEIEPIRPGELMRVEATYDKNAYELTESLDRGEGAGWTYDVRFRSSGSNFMSGLRQRFGGMSPKVHVFLPADVPLSLEVVLVEGGGRLDLGECG